MNINVFLSKLQSSIEENIGYELRKDYVSMSHLGDCARVVAQTYQEGFKFSESSHRMALRGYAVKRAVLPLYVKAGLVNGLFETEIRADFSSAFRTQLVGHCDGVLTEGGVLEIKSVSDAKFRVIFDNKRAQRSHFRQVQTYMHFGKFRQAVIAYWNAETFDVYHLFVSYVPKIGNEFEAKARSILTALDAGRLPMCTCGKCPAE